MTAARAVERTAVGLAAGLPLGLAATVMPALLRGAGTSLAGLGLATLVVGPWASRPLWSPLLGARVTHRAWAPSMLALVALTFGVASALGVGAAGVVAIVGVTSTFAALAAARGDDASASVGLELGRALGGGLLFALPMLGAEALGAEATTGPLAVAALVALVAAIVVAAANAPAAASRVEGRALATELRDLVTSKGGGSIVALVATASLGELLVVAILPPYALDHGVSLSELTATLGAGAGVAAIGGVAIGGALRRRREPLGVLGIAALLRIAPLFGAAVIAQAEPTVAGIFGVAAGAAFFGGVVSSALDGFVEATRRARGDARAQALSAIAGLGRWGAWVLAGVLAEQHGYLGVFVLGAAAAVVFLWTVGSARKV